MSRKYGNLLGTFLEAIGSTTGLFRWPPEGSREWIYREVRSSRKNYQRYYNSLGHLKKRGLVKTINKNGKKFLKLTSKGELELLLIKAKLPSLRTPIWDKKWRVIIFDIPESSRDKRA